jgi:hypothetical protein
MEDRELRNVSKNCEEDGRSVGGGGNEGGWGVYAMIFPPLLTSRPVD